MSLRSKLAGSEVAKVGGMSIAELPIQIDREKVAEFCRARGISKLSLFGSVLRDDFDLERNDVDVLAEFEPGALRGLGFRYFGYGDQLAEILGCRVDFFSAQPSLRYRDLARGAHDL